MWGALVRNAAVAAVGLMVTGAMGSISIDLRFADGSKSRTVSTNDLTPIQINAWVEVNGTAGNSNPEGLYFIIAALQSRVVQAGIGGAITSSSLATGWNSNGSFLGGASNLTSDGIGDWGNVSNTPLTMVDSQKYFRARTTKSLNNPVDWGDANSPVGSVNHLLADGGKEYLIGSFVFTPTSMSHGASLRYDPATPLGGINSVAGWFEDSPNKTASIPSGSKTQNTGVIKNLTPNASGIGGVTINVLPEPVTLGLTVLGAMGLMHRRRK